MARGMNGFLFPACLWSFVVIFWIVFCVVYGMGPDSEQYGMIFFLGILGVMPLFVVHLAINIWVMRRNIVDPFHNGFKIVVLNDSDEIIKIEKPYWGKKNLEEYTIVTPNVVYKDGMKTITIGTFVKCKIKSVLSVEIPLKIEIVLDGEYDTREIYKKIAKFCKYTHCVVIADFIDDAFRAVNDEKEEVLGDIIYQYLFERKIFYNKIDNEIFEIIKFPDKLLSNFSSYRFILGKPKSYSVSLIT